MTQAELRGKRFTGEVARTAASIDAATRTMQIEVSLPNRDGALLPGAYVNVSLPLQASGALLVPSNTLLFRAEGTSVATVDAQGRARLRPVNLGRNFGQTTEVLDGINGSDRLVLNPSDSISEGDQLAFAPQAQSASAAKPGTAAKEAQ